MAAVNYEHIHDTLLRLVMACTCCSCELQRRLKEPPAAVVRGGKHGGYLGVYLVARDRKYCLGYGFGGTVFCSS